MTPSSQTYQLLRTEMAGVAEHYEELAAEVAPFHPIAAHQFRQMALIAQDIARSTDARIREIEAAGQGKG